MSSQENRPITLAGLWNLFKQALVGEHQDYTSLSIRRAIFLLSVPMILEMCMESIFALVDIFFVGGLGQTAVSTVGLTESVLSLVYAVAIGLSMAATALVARRVGEQNVPAAARTGAQAILLAVAVSLVIGLAGVVLAPEVLRLMGANADIVAVGTPYMRLVLGGNLVVMLLFLVNGIFRGAGDASKAMHSLWIANVGNIVLCPVLIYGLGPIPGFGLLGAAMATTLGRGVGVGYQFYHLFRGRGPLRVQWRDFLPDRAILASLLRIALTGTLQFLIGSASWVFMARIVAQFGSTAIAGYTVAIRVIVFFILPAWGMSNAAATLVGQNLGAKRPDRAEQSVWQTAQYSAIFMVLVSLTFFFGGDLIVGLLNKDAAVKQVATEALRVISLGYIFYGVGMIVISSFNGAGDTRTPTLINFVCFWCLQIPLAYWLANSMGLAERGVFWAVLLSETAIAISGAILFRRGKWKMVQV
jgi:putative MATE family efflux protein